MCKTLHVTHDGLPLLCPSHRIVLTPQGCLGLVYEWCAGHFGTVPCDYVPGGASSELLVQLFFGQVLGAQHKNDGVMNPVEMKKTWLVAMCGAGTSLFDLDRSPPERGHILEAVYGTRLLTTEVHGAAFVFSILVRDYIAQSVSEVKVQW